MLFCIFGFHNWAEWKNDNFNKWKTVKEQKVLNAIDNSVIGTALTQKRKCKKCGYEQIDLQVKTV